MQSWYQDSLPVIKRSWLRRDNKRRIRCFNLSFLPAADLDLEPPVANQQPERCIYRFPVKWSLFNLFRVQRVGLVCLWGLPAA